MNSPNKQFERLKVVVIDDHDSIRKAISRALTSIGFCHVEEFSDGREATEHIKKSHVDLVLSDIYMKHLGGYEVLRLIRARDFSNDIPVILVTGEAQKDEIVKANDLGAEHYILKPFTAADLQRVVTHVCESYVMPPPLIKLQRDTERALFEGDIATAQKSLGEALAIDPAAARTLYNQALIQVKTEDFLAAQKTLQNIISSQPSFFRSYRLLANIYLDRGDHLQAVHYLTKELDINGSQEDRWTLLGTCFMALKQYEAALASFRDALKLNPKFFPALNGMGHALGRAGNLEKSLYYFKRIRRNNPEQQSALQGMMRYAKSPEDLHKVELTLKDEINRNPDRQDAKLVLAQLNYQRGDEEASLKILDQILADKENHREALLLKMKVKLKQKSYDEALAIGKTLCKVAPNLEVFTTVGRMLLQLKRYAETLSVCEQALSMDYKEIGILSLQCDAYHLTGQDGKAYFLMMRLINMKSNDKALKQKLSIILNRIYLRRGTAPISQDLTPKAS